MLQRERIASAHDAVTNIPDELDVSAEQMRAIATVLGLLLQVMAKLDRVRTAASNAGRCGGLVPITKGRALVPISSD